MTRACRQTCTGETFDHDETVMSIAKANELLRCPICQREVGLSSETSDATPRVQGGRTTIRVRR